MLLTDPLAGLVDRTQRFEKRTVSGGPVIAVTVACEMRECVPDALEIVNPALDLVDLFACTRLDYASRRVRIEAQSQQISDLDKRESELLRAPNEAKSVNCRGVILAISRRGSARIVQKTTPFVVTHRLNVHTSTARQLTDFHTSRSVPRAPRVRASPFQYPD